MVIPSDAGGIFRARYRGNIVVHLPLYQTQNVNQKIQDKNISHNNERDFDPEQPGDWSL
jgi:hypothetical protein